MASDDLCLLELVEVGRRSQVGQLSSVEVTQAVLDRIARLDGRLKSYATLTADLALAQAAQADAEIARGGIRGPLHGVPIAVKDLCYTKGIPTAAGTMIYKDYRPPWRVDRPAGLEAIRGRGLCDGVRCRVAETPAVTQCAICGPYRFARVNAPPPDDTAQILVT